MDKQKIGKAGTFILGGVAGTIAGILIAPRSGRELRGAMSSRAGEARERSRESYYEARERAREHLSGVSDLRPVDEGMAEMPLSDTLPEEPEEASPVPVSPDNPPSHPGPDASPWLRAVPPEEVLEEVSEEDPEALRRRIRQTRDRLRRRDLGEETNG